MKIICKYGIIFIERSDIVSIVLIAFLLLILYKSKIYLKGNNNENYMSINTTTCIKGIFVFFILLSHSMQYVNYNNKIDILYTLFQNKMGQLIVCMFLFYSGYGIYESIKKKGQSYIKRLPKDRILKLLIHFDIALVFYYILSLIIGTKYGFKQIVLSLIGWDSLGNSNWFIFAILVCYFISYLCFSLIKKDRISIAFVTAFSVAYILLMRQFKPTFWFDTILCFPLGMIFSYCREWIERKFLNNNIIYYILLTLTSCVFFFFLKYQNIYTLLLNSMVFSILIVLITFKIDINNKILLWLGKNVFNIYILQRIPMTLLSHFFNFPSYVFVLLAFIIVVIISIMFDKLLSFVDSIFFKKKAIK